MLKGREARPGRRVARGRSRAGTCYHRWKGGWGVGGCLGIWCWKHVITLWPPGRILDVQIVMFTLSPKTAVCRVERGWQGRGLVWRKPCKAECWVEGQS